MHQKEIIAVESSAGAPLECASNLSVALITSGKRRHLYLAIAVSAALSIIPLCITAYCTWILAVTAQSVAHPKYDETMGTVREVSIRQLAPVRKSRVLVKCCYLYKVEGIAYEGSRLALWKVVFLSDTEASEFKNHFVAGATVPVYYEKDSPSNSVLLNAMGSGTIWFYSIGAVMGLIVGGVFSASSYVFWRPALRHLKDSGSTGAGRIDSDSTKHLVQ